MPLTNDLYPDRLGFCYVLTNPFIYARDPVSGGEVPLLKIGATRKHPLSRAKELSAATGVPGDFSLAYYLSYADCFTAETLLHQRFDDRRTNDSREFFAVHVDEVREVMDGLAASAAYRDKVGGEEELDQLRGGARVRRSKPVATPFAEMFASFEDRGDGVLNEAEQAQCRALESRR